MRFYCVCPMIGSLHDPYLLYHLTCTYSQVVVEVDPLKKAAIDSRRRLQCFWDFNLILESHPTQSRSARTKKSLLGGYRESKPTAEFPLNYIFCRYWARCICQDWPVSQSIKQWGKSVFKFWYINLPYIIYYFVKISVHIT